MRSMSIKTFVIKSLMVLTMLCLFVLFNKSVLSDPDIEMDFGVTTSRKIIKTYTSDITAHKNPVPASDTIEDTQLTENKEAKSELLPSESAHVPASSSLCRRVTQEKKIGKNFKNASTPDYDPYIQAGAPIIFRFWSILSPRTFSVSANEQEYEEVTESMLASNKVPLQELFIPENVPEIPLSETVPVPVKTEVLPDVPDVPDVPESPMVENGQTSPEPVYTELVNVAPPQLPPLGGELEEFLPAQEVTPESAIGTKVGFIQEIAHTVKKEPVLFPPVEMEKEPTQAQVIYDPEIFGTFPIEADALYDVVPSPHFGLKEPVSLPMPEATSEDEQRTVTKRGKMRDFPPIE